MNPEDRDLMIELSKRIVRETDIRVMIDELNELIQSKIREIRHSRPPS